MHKYIQTHPHTYVCMCEIVLRNGERDLLSEIEEIRKKVVILFIHSYSFVNVVILFSPNTVFVEFIRVCKYHYLVAFKNILKLVLHKHKQTVSV